MFRYGTLCATVRHRAIAAFLALAAAGAGGCGGGTAATDAGTAAQSPPAAAKSSRKLPAPLASLQDQSNQLLDGGVPAFDARLKELRGYPVVVNKWASWCTPCRFEFSFFRSQAEKRAGEVAFIGVDAQDVDVDAEKFLAELPVPYPSYKDPDLKISEELGAVAAFPATAFYEADGELAFLKQGGYPTEELLAVDIDRYANPPRGKGK
jgi:cytochrome c biogenesis protein CcmG, thiol:disulfide interchange protein DsbE